MTTCKIVKLNADDNQQTAAQFEVLSIPTLILFKHGQRGHEGHRRDAEEAPRGRARARARRLALLCFFFAASSPPPPRAPSAASPAPGCLPFACSSSSPTSSVSFLSRWCGIWSLPLSRSRRSASAAWISSPCATAVCSASSSAGSACSSVSSVCDSELDQVLELALVAVSEPQRAVDRLQQVDQHVLERVERLLVAPARGHLVEDAPWRLRASAAARRAAPPSPPATAPRRPGFRGLRSSCAFDFAIMCSSAWLPVSCDRSWMPAARFTGRCVEEPPPGFLPPAPRLRWPWVAMRRSYQRLPRLAESPPRGASTVREICG